MASTIDLRVTLRSAISTQDTDMVLHTFLRGSFHGSRFLKCSHLLDLGNLALQFVALDPLDHSQLQTKK